MGLALTSLLLQPAHTTGLAGLEIGLDFGYAPVGAGVVGTPPYEANVWPTSGAAPIRLSPSAVIGAGYHAVSAGAADNGIVPERHQIEFRDIRGLQVRTPADAHPEEAE